MQAWLSELYVSVSHMLSYSQAIAFHDSPPEAEVQGGDVRISACCPRRGFGAWRKAATGCWAG